MSGPLYIHGLGHFHPENVIDNRFLESLDIGTSDEWIMERVGIRERRTVLPLDYLRTTRNARVEAAEEAALYDNAETARRAARLALERAGLPASAIGMVVSGGCAPSACIPSDACRVAAALGLEVPALDINSACSSFGAQLRVLAAMDDLPPFVLVVNPENTTRVVDYRDRSSAVLWGDGTSAAVVSRTEPAPLRLVRASFGSRPSGADAVTIPRFGHFRQDGPGVQRFAIKTTLSSLEEMLPAARARALETGGRVRFIGHQANGLMLQGVAERARLDPSEHWHHVEDFGNTGAAGAPSVLSERWAELAPGDAISMVVVGSGLAWSSLALEVRA